MTEEASDLRKERNLEFRDDRVRWPDKEADWQDLMQPWLLIKTLASGREVHWLDGFVLFREWRERDQDSAYPDLFRSIVSKAKGFLGLEEIPDADIRSIPNHKEQADGNRNRNHRRAINEDGHAIEFLRQSGRKLPKHNPANDAQRHPNSQIAFEDVCHLPFVCGQLVAHILLPFVTPLRM